MKDDSRQPKRLPGMALQLKAMLHCVLFFSIKHCSGGKSAERHSLAEGVGGIQMGPPKAVEVRDFIFNRQFELISPTA